MVANSASTSQRVNWGMDPAVGVSEGRRWRAGLLAVDRSTDAAALTATRHHVRTSLLTSLER